MAKDNVRIEKSIASLVEATDSLLKGDFHRDLLLIDAEGLLSDLAQKINAMMINMQTVEKPLSDASKQAPNTVDKAESVMDLMTQSTSDVLNKSDQLVSHLNDLEKYFLLKNMTESETILYMKEKLPSMKSLLFEIIASQSYQDVARQKMEKLVSDLVMIRNWLINVLVILNIKYNTSNENVEKKANLLREIKTNVSEDMKQDLIDDLLAEFGS
jgi:chemotaxis regulatin CheY-phosphate phosphatase CheZ